jgi:hypothetical protein
MGAGVAPPGVNQQGHEADHSPTFTGGAIPPLPIHLNDMKRKELSQGIVLPSHFILIITTINRFQHEFNLMINQLQNN